MGRQRDWQNHATGQASKALRTSAIMEFVELCKCEGCLARTPKKQEIDTAWLTVRYTPCCLVVGLRSRHRWRVRKVCSCLRSSSDLSVQAVCHPASDASRRCCLGR